MVFHYFSWIFIQLPILILFADFDTYRRAAVDIKYITLTSFGNFLQLGFSYKFIGI